MGEQKNLIPALPRPSGGLSCSLGAIVSAFMACLPRLSRVFDSPFKGV